MDNLANKSSAEIGNIQDEKEKELQEAIKAYSKVEQEILLLRRASLEAAQNIKVIQSELRVLKHLFFAAKDGGL